MEACTADGHVTSLKIVDADNDTRGAQGVTKIILGSGKAGINFYDKWAAEIVFENDKGASVAMDLSFVDPQYDLQFEVRQAGQVAVDDGAGHCATVYGVADITGGLGNNTYRFVGDASISGKLTGAPLEQSADKINTLDYSKVKKLDGGDGVDQLFGGAHDDVLFGGPGDDVVQKGGSGNDTYKFVGDWGSDKVQEEASGGEMDTLDFSQVTEGVTYTLSGHRIESGTGTFELNAAESSRRQTTPLPFAAGTGDASGTFTGGNHVQTDAGYIERIVAADADNTFYFGNDWGGSGGGRLELDTSRVAAEGSEHSLVLDFRAVTKALKFTFLESGQVLIEKHSPTSYADPYQSWIIVTQVHPRTVIYGGSDRNVFAVENGAPKFPGRVEGTFGVRNPLGTLSASPFVENTLDYSQYRGVVNVALNVLPGAPQVATRFEKISNMDDVIYGNGWTNIVGSLTGNTFEPGLLSPALASLCIMAGMTGGDTYVFGPVLNTAAVLEVPELPELGGELISGFDTLDFSRTLNDLRFEVRCIGNGDTAMLESLLQSMNVSGDDMPSFAVGDTYILVKPVVFGHVSPVPTVFANNIENIIGGRGENTIVLIGEAELKGTVSAAVGGSVTLDYSQYFKGSDPGQEGVSVDAGSGPEPQVLPPVDMGFYTIPPKYITFGSATGILGERFGEADFFGWIATCFPDFPLPDPIPWIFADFAVSDVGGIIGSPREDNLRASKDTRLIQMGPEDSVYGRGVARVELRAEDGSESPTESAPAAEADPVLADLSAGRTIFGPPATSVTVVQEGDAASGWSEVQEVQTSATDGTFRIFFKGCLTGEVPYSAEAGQVAQELNSLSSISGVGGVTVEGAAGSPWQVTFNGAGDVGVLRVIDSVAAGDAAMGTLSDVQDVSGGPGDDVLVGSGEDNTYVFGENWGNDLVIEVAEGGATGSISGRVPRPWPFASS